jgi:hypothetical protein
MRSKGITTHAIYTIGFIVISILVIVIGIQHFLETFSGEATEYSCNAKLVDYCTGWEVTGYDTGREPFVWEEKTPHGCEEFGIYKPQGPDDCE